MKTNKKTSNSSCIETGFIRVFRVRKVPLTPPEGHVILMSKQEPFNIAEKKSFYTGLGYVVTDL